MNNKIKGYKKNIYIKVKIVKNKGTIKVNYKIGAKVPINKIESVAKGIVKKALKVIETSGNLFATRIIENKDIDTFKDLVQSVILKLIENDYIITKDCYKIVNHILYNYKIDKINNVEIIVNEETNVSNIEIQSLIEYIRNENNFINETNTKNKFSLKELQLTNKQLEILNIWSAGHSLSETANICNVCKGTIQNTIDRIKAKALKLINSIEY